MKIAVFCPNWVGDLVMATPALRAVRHRFPDAEIFAILRPYVAEVLAGLDLVDHVLLHKPHGGAAADRGWQFVRRLRQHDFDWALILPNSFRSGLLAWCSGAKRRVGMDRNGRGWLLTDRVPSGNRDVPHPVIDEYLRLAERMECTHLTRNMELATTRIDEQQLQSFWRLRVDEHGTPHNYICFNPGGAFGAAKHWPSDSFAELARNIAEQQQKRVLVLCGPAERDAARSIVAQSGHPQVFSLADEAASLGLTKAAIKHCDLLVTTDSGPRHFAAPFQVPVVTLFGPTHIAWSETFYEKGLHLQLDVDCGPCQARTCPLQHHRCMRDLTVSKVYEAVVTLLDRYSIQTAA